MLFGSAAVLDQNEGVGNKPGTHKVHFSDLNLMCKYNFLTPAFLFASIFGVEKGQDQGGFSGKIV